MMFVRWNAEHEKINTAATGENFFVRMERLFHLPIHRTNALNKYAHDLKSEFRIGLNQGEKLLLVEGHENTVGFCFGSRAPGSEIDEGHLSENIAPAHTPDQFVPNPQLDFAILDDVHLVAPLPFSKYYLTREDLFPLSSRPRVK
jgi:hypothetical protein